MFALFISLLTWLDSAGALFEEARASQKQEGARRGKRSAPSCVYICTRCLFHFVCHPPEVAIRGQEYYRQSSNGSWNGGKDLASSAAYTAGFCTALLKAWRA